MKITDIRANPVQIPHAPNMAFKFHHRTSTLAHVVLIKVITDEGIMGIAEAPARPHLYGETIYSIVSAVEHHLRPALLGMDPFDVEKIRWKMEPPLPGLVGNPTAKAAIDVAIHDIICKKLGIPVYKFLGGWNDGKVVAGWMIGVRETEEMAMEAQLMAKKGFRFFKVKAVSPPLSPQKDVENIKAIREAVGEKAIISIDANQVWSPQTAVSTIKKLEDYGIAWVEEPCPIYDSRGRLKVSKSISVPILGDESCTTVQRVKRELDLGAIGMVSIKIARTGFFDSRKIVYLAEQYGIPCIIGSQAETGLGTVAAAHFAKAFAHTSTYPTELGYFLRLEDDLLKLPLNISDGCVEVPNRPGIGVETDEEKLEKYRKIIEPRGW